MSPISYNDASIFDILDEQVYIIDVNSYELLFMNKTLCREFNIQQYEGRRCYQVLQGLEKPCSFCNMDTLRKSQAPCEQKVYNPIVHKYFQLKDSLITFRNHEARLEIAFEITAYEHQKQELQNAMEAEEFLKQCIQVLDSSRNFPEALQLVLAKIGRYLGADRSYVFKLDHEKLYNTYEWCKEGVHSEKDNLQEIDVAVIDRWMDKFLCHESVVITDIETIRETQPVEYAIMSRQNIRTYVTTPIEMNNAIVGFIGVDNPEMEKIRNIGPLLISLSYFLTASYLNFNSYQALERQKNVLEETIEHIPAGLCIFQKINGQIQSVAANPYYAEMLGVPQDEVPGRTWEYFEQMIHPDDRNRHFEETISNLDHNHRTQGTYRIYNRKLHRYLWLHLEGRLAWQGDGKELAYYCYTDVTTQKESEDELKKQREEQYHRSFQELMITNPLSLGTVRVDLTHNVCKEIHGNVCYIKEIVMGCTFDTLIGCMLKLIPDAGDRAAFCSTFDRKRLLQAFQRGRTDCYLQYRCQYLNGTVHWIETYLHMVQNPYNGAIEAVTYTENIDDKVREQKLLQRVVDEMYDYVGVIHIAEETLEFGHVGFRMQDRLDSLHLDKHIIFPYDSLCIRAKEWILPQDWEQISPCFAIPYLQQQLACHKTFQKNVRGRMKDGSLVCKQLRYSYLDESRQMILVEQIDISELYLDQQERLQKEKLLSQEATRANQLKSEFLSNVSHDMRTPLNGILGYAKLAREGNDVQVIRDYLEKINESGTILHQLIDDMLDLNKIENGSVTLNLQPMDCHVLFSRIEAAVRPAMDDKELQFFLDCSGAAMVQVQADILRLEQIFINLLSNAIKFTPRGGRVECIMECQNQDETYVYDKISVKDTGIGMSPEFLPKIFEPLSQERNEKNSHIGGSGLGLTIAKQFIELMGGRIEVQSVLGEGTRFYVYLAFEKVRQTAVTPQAPVSRNLKGRRVLLCEDNELNTEIAQMILQSQGIDVVCAAHGQEGVKIFAQSQEFSIDVILMDLRMPVMDGYDAAKTIRKLKRRDAQTVPIIAVSADAFDSDIKRCLDCGMNDHVAKPINTEELYFKLEQCCQASRPVGSA